MKKEYTIPESKVRLTKIQTLLLGGSNTKPDGTQRPTGTEGAQVGDPTTSYDARKRMFTME